MSMQMFLNIVLISTLGAALFFFFKDSKSIKEMEEQDVDQLTYDMFVQDRNCALMIAILVFIVLAVETIAWWWLQ